ncbi:DUF6562 domain-containing protein [uncultured Alistipes sp.]|uniref:DUF6562 domain-containing protein n=1 Tax=uncultured Alistipes sp. TaxID=538949 RepID=UPI00338F958F
MRRLFLLAAGLAMTLTACQKDEGLVSDGATSQTITVTIPQGMHTRATAADFGNGAKVDRCLLQIYRSGTTPAKYGEQQSATVQKGTDGKLTATFNLRLVASQTYDFVFWADCSTGDHYNTDDLTNITVKGDYAGNNDEFDAFTGALLDYQVTGAFSENITLRRPFGQLNVKTLDLAAIPDPALKPTKVKVAFTAVPTSFNARKSEVGTTTAAAEYTADVLSADGDLTVDYIWAPVEEATLADFSMTFLNGTTEISTNDDFKNIPDPPQLPHQCIRQPADQTGYVQRDDRSGVLQARHQRLSRTACRTGQRRQRHPVGRRDDRGAAGRGNRQDGRDRPERAYDYERNRCVGRKRLVAVLRPWRIAYRQERYGKG